MSILSPVVTVLINLLLEIVNAKMVRYERCSSESERSVATARKIFLSMFVNTALVLLAVNMQMPKEIEMSKTSELTKSKDGGFIGEIQWYTNVGGPILLTMLLNTVTPHVKPVGTMLFLLPFRR